MCVCLCNAEREGGGTYDVVGHGDEEVEEAAGRNGSHLLVPLCVC